MLRKKAKDVSRENKNEPGDTSISSMDYSGILNLYSSLTKNSLEQVSAFIDKVAIWYEFTNSDNYIRKLYVSRTATDLEKSSESSFLDDLNIKYFINTLTNGEKDFLRKPCFICDRWSQEIDIKFKNLDHDGPLYITGDNIAGFELSKSGTIIYTDRKALNYLIGHKITELPELVTQRGLKIQKCSQQIIEEYNKKYENSLFVRKILLGAIARRIIDRASSKEVGIIRAIHFTRDFGIMQQLLMDYGIPQECSSYNRAILNEYIKALTTKKSKLKIDSLTIKYGEKTIKMRDLLKTLNNYTPEEHELHERLANTILSGIDMSELANQAEEERKEEVKHFRIERK